MNHRGFINVVLVVIAVAIIGTAGYFVFVRKTEPVIQKPQSNQVPTPTPIPTPTPTPIQAPINQPTPTLQDQTIKWKLYENKELGFSIQYPSDWTQTDLIQANDELIFSFKDTRNTNFRISYVKNDPQYDLKVDSGLGEGMSPIRIGGYNGGIVSLHASTKRYNGDEISFELIPASSDVSLFKKLLATVKFNEVNIQYANSETEKRDEIKNKNLKFTMQTLEFYFDKKGLYPSNLSDPEIDPKILSSYGVDINSLTTFAYSPTPDRKNYHIGVTFETVTSKQIRFDDDFNSLKSGFTNGFDGYDLKKCRSQDKGMACDDFKVQ
ncbi:MAG: hypothetical protein HYT98_04705 [Candidatus Sungbacteria bacterium]|nr:hypothetical protein [Candidatus Sungbacteria bacterium]